MKLSEEQRIYTVNKAIEILKSKDGWLLRMDQVFEKASAGRYFIVKSEFPELEKYGTICDRPTGAGRDERLASMVLLLRDIRAK